MDSYFNILMWWRMLLQHLWRGYRPVRCQIVRGIPRDLKRPSRLRSYGSCQWMAVVLVAMLPICLTPPAFADTDEAQEHVSYKQVTGTVVRVMRQAISVEYSHDTKKGESYEILMPFSEDTRLRYLKSINELKPGDTISIQYAQTYRDNGKEEPMLVGTTATEIALVRRAPTQGMSSRESDSP